MSLHLSLFGIGKLEVSSTFRLRQQEDRVSWRTFFNRALGQLFNLIVNKHGCHIQPQYKINTIILESIPQTPRNPNLSKNGTKRKINIGLCLSFTTPLVKEGGDATKVDNGATRWKRPRVEILCALKFYFPRETYKKVTIYFSLILD